MIRVSSDDGGGDSHSGRSGRIMRAVLPPAGLRVARMMAWMAAGSVRRRLALTAIEFALPLASVGAAVVIIYSADYAHWRSEEHTSELQSQFHLVCRLLLEK